PTLYWLDGHWLGPPTAGQDAQCPVLDEIAQLDGGHLDDCILIDDARCFTAAPPPPFEPEQWPTVVEVIEALRAVRPTNHVTVIHDLIISVPGVTKPVVDRYAWGQPDPEQLAAPTAPSANGQTSPSVSST